MPEAAPFTYRISVASNLRIAVASVFGGRRRITEHFFFLSYNYNPTLLNVDIHRMFAIIIQIFQ